MHVFFEFFMSVNFLGLWYYRRKMWIGSQCYFNIANITSLIEYAKKNEGNFFKINILCIILPLDFV